MVFDLGLVFREVARVIIHLDMSAELRSRQR